MAHDAITKGVEELPTISDSVRSHVMQLYKDEGIEGIRLMLRNLDPDYLASADRPTSRRSVPRHRNMP